MTDGHAWYTLWLANTTKEVNSVAKTVVKIDLDENMDVHAKAYIRPSMDKLVKLYQARLIRETGLNITYSEAMRQVMNYGLIAALGSDFDVQYTGGKEINWANLGNGEQYIG